MVISENKKKLISLLTRYDSRKFIESIIAILDSEEEKTSHSRNGACHGNAPAGDLTGGNP